MGKKMMRVYMYTHNLQIANMKYSSAYDLSTSLSQAKFMYGVFMYTPCR